MGFGEVTEHESFGTVAISHVTGGGRGGGSLFGSSIRHNEVIRLRVSHAKLDRHLNYDSVYETGRIVEVDLSYSQFAEFVTTHNRGTGIPCTIRNIGNREVEPPPFINKREQHRKEFQDTASKIARKLDELVKLAESFAEKSSTTKQERKQLAAMARYARQCISSDMPFAVSQFDEQMDKSVLEAKGELEGFALRRVITAGMAAIESEDVAPPVIQLEYDSAVRGSGEDAGVFDIGAGSEDDGVQALPTAGLPGGGEVQAGEPLVPPAGEAESVVVEEVPDRREHGASQA